METFSALLASCAGNSPVPGEFPAQRPVTRNFDVYFDLRLNKRLSKQSWGWWFETPLRPLWRHRNVKPTSALTITSPICKVWSWDLHIEDTTKVISNHYLSQWWHVSYEPLRIRYNVYKINFLQFVPEIVLGIIIYNIGWALHELIIFIYLLKQHFIKT